MFSSVKNKIYNYLGFKVFNYYRSKGYTGRFDFILKNSYWKYTLEYPMVYFRISDKRNIVCQFNSPIFKKMEEQPETELKKFDMWYVNGVRANDIPNINVDAKGNVYERIF